MQDVRNSNGKWLQNTKNPEGGYSLTRAGILWSNLKQRLRGSSVRNESYLECFHNFLGFQDFAEWCQQQENYTSKDEKGRYYHLDKDILFANNKIYSKETCCFIPADLNMVLSKGNNKTNKYLIGTCFVEKVGRFTSHVTGHPDLKHGYLGIYDTEIEAHRAWQLGKIQVLEHSINKFSYLPPSILEGLTKHIQLIQKQFNSNETTS
jgi:hypothetical protein